MTVSNHSPDEEVFTLRDLLANYYALARRGVRYWIRGAAVFTAIFLVGIVMVVNRARVYKSEAAFQILDSNTAQREEQGEETVQRSIEGRLNQIYGSRRYVMNIVRELHLYDHLLGVAADGRPFTSEAKIVQQFQGAMDSRVERTIVHLGFTYRDPLRAQQVVQALIRLFVNERKMAAEEQARDMLNLVDGQLRELDGVLQQRQDALDRFTLANQPLVDEVRARQGIVVAGVGRVPSGGNGPRAAEPGVSAGTRRARGRVAQLEAELNGLRNPSAAATAGGGDDTPEIVALRERVRQKREQVGGLRSRGMTPDHPTRASAERELAELESELNGAVGRARGVQRERENLSAGERAARIERLTRDLAEARDELNASERTDAQARNSGQANAAPVVPARPVGALNNIVEVEAQYNRLTNELLGARNAYNDLLRRKLDRQADLRRIQLAGGETVRIIDPPSRPVEPEPPGRTKLAAIVIFVALLLGAGTALVSGFIDTRVYDLTDLRRWGELPELPFVPELHLDAPAARPPSAPPRGG